MVERLKFKPGTPGWDVFDAVADEVLLHYEAPLDPVMFDWVRDQMTQRLAEYRFDFGPDGGGVLTRNPEGFVMFCVLVDRLGDETAPYQITLRNGYEGEEKCFERPSPSGP